MHLSFKTATSVIRLMLQSGAYIIQQDHQIYSNEKVQVPVFAERHHNVRSSKSDKSSRAQLVSKFLHIRRKTPNPNVELQ
ncbi:hypothetical protein EYC80_000426 [Monilinia laxa]|uniref:Uncharacterized protein n=1 Tax=Monilinia laxa TaxID=61186 RepID=A0A5N6KAJ5_MONLA|nr:hypothetical protein EYC80_000426 [Monilinia laxa]